ncbi:hypothetical protein P6709_18375 [Jeotgalibacillus sp. ET6]|nr:hypothetical protein [Jeotgalibacillus sp. ET6]MDG5473698.1 hypothetical protein [Jeotgalibacillus sp. ET6]
MHLHKEKEVFLEIIAATSEDTGIPEESLKKEFPILVFKAFKHVTV